MCLIVCSAHNNFIQEWKIANRFRDSMRLPSRYVFFGSLFGCDLCEGLDLWWEKKGRQGVESETLCILTISADRTRESWFFGNTKAHNSEKYNRMDLLFGARQRVVLLRLRDFSGFNDLSSRVEHYKIPAHTKSRSREHPRSKFLARFSRNTNCLSRRALRLRSSRVLQNLYILIHIHKPTGQKIFTFRFHLPRDFDEWLES